MSVRRAIFVAGLLGAAALLAIALAGGLETVDFASGRILSEGTAPPPSDRGWRGDLGGTLGVPGFDPFKILLPVCLGLLVVSVAFSIRDRSVRPHLLASILLFAAAVLVMNFVIPQPAKETEPLVEEEGTAPVDDEVPRATGVPRARVEPPPSATGSRWPIIVSSALAASLIGLVAWPIAARWLRRRRSSGAPSEATALLEIAANAAREIESGEDPIGVVQRCYARMLHALSERASVDPTYRTPREFAASLRDAGLGGPSVDALTEMFEFVRYGGRTDEPFAQRAHACLSALRLGHDAV